ncbi:hypothetical protein [Nodularia spumigena]|uniref:hypothetical protein n=2 Tax=Nodularia spumigena TaxID=70799 RepID=UPI00232F4E43|nr:hypothetical protein [Nodularia spumigena]MDB9324016.1 hypothetical protein [Nodularia spumigena CS-591/07A]MDB9340372.1 hypothetical protein [Nodularia spumigena CS-589/07]MDB9345099.1 hypothetical protein [Nodularia spumigena CS-588/06]MDB9346782.1 hypothetical protein [Nodularia spumigena CS-588/01]MDB9353248.1 hypothetical protein [Nodularia spumigena CS-588/05]
MGKKKQKKRELSPDKDIRFITTRKIWEMTVGIFAICIPLAGVTRSGPILPLAAIFGATLSTVAVWRSDEKNAKSHDLSAQQLEILQQRLANLETIVSSDEFDLNKKIKQLEITEKTKRSRNKKNKQ